MKQSEGNGTASADRSSESGTIFDIQSYAVHDGPGVRTLAFMKGCPLRCWWCHNPEGRSPTVDLMFFDTLCTRTHNCISSCDEGAITTATYGSTSISREKCTLCGKCTYDCPTSALKIIGREVSLQYLIGEIEKYKTLYSDPSGGVTFTGGEPLMQPDFLLGVLKTCKEHYISTAIETSGYASRATIESILPYTDLFLFDIKLYDDRESLKYTGVTCRPIKENLEYVLHMEKRTILRFPVIPRITDTEENVTNWVTFVSGLKGIREIDLLPFHDVDEKYYRLGMEYKMTVHEAPSKNVLNRIKEKFESIGLRVKIGG